MPPALNLFAEKNEVSRWAKEEMSVSFSYTLEHRFCQSAITPCARCQAIAESLAESLVNISEELTDRIGANYKHVILHTIRQRILEVPLPKPKRLKLRSRDGD